MIRITKIILVIISAIAVFACSAPNPEQSKTAKARAAQDRINASKSSADVITKDLDD